MVSLRQLLVKLYTCYHISLFFLIFKYLTFFFLAGIVLSTRNDSVLLIDPPIGDASQVKNWFVRRVFFTFSEFQTYQFYIVPAIYVLAFIFY